MVVERRLDLGNAMTKRVDQSSTRRVVAVPEPELVVSSGDTRARRETPGLLVAILVESFSKNVLVPVDG